VAGIETKKLKYILAVQALSPTTAMTIGKIGFGEGDSTPTPDDTALTNPYIKTVLSKKVNADNSITCTYTLDYSEANGKTIKEIGLYCNDGVTLVAREVRDTIVKDRDTAIEGAITILI
jgi:hypothetical protein